MRKRILKVGFENFLIPERITDQKIAAAISVLRELVPCDFYGNESKARDSAYEINYQCIRAGAKKKGVAEVPLEEFQQ
ncbi:MAG: hypothetical protein AAGU11_06260 [Syntrophobacteraceae bacterium]